MSARTAEAPRALMRRRRVDALVKSPGRFVAAMVPFFAALLWLDRYVDRRGQLLLGAATWLVLLLAARALPAERRAQVAIVVVAATCAELTGSILWGVYSYRLANLPSFVPPAHGLVYLTGLSLSRVLAGRERALVGVALAGALGWGLAGLTVLPRLDVAGAIGVPLLAVFLWRSARAASTRASYSPSQRSSSTEPPSARGSGIRRCRGWGYPTAIRRAVPRAATSASTSSRSRSLHGSWPASGEKTGPATLRRRAGPQRRLTR